MNCHLIEFITFDNSSCDRCDTGQRGSLNDYNKKIFHLLQQGRFLLVFVSHFGHAFWGHIRNPKMTSWKCKRVIITQFFEKRRYFARRLCPI